MHTLSLFLALLLSVSSSNNFVVSCLSIELIHRESPLSPFYDPSKTQTELIRNAAFRSRSRSHGLDHLQTEVVPEGGGYIMRIYVGTPPVQTWAVADTGSNLVWLQCLPCTKCYPQDPPLFKPKKSSTYRTVSCRSKPCTFLPKGYSSCGKSKSNSKHCVYFYGYADNSITRGELVSDFINFGGRSGNLIRHRSVFGCGHDNRGTYSRAFAGIVGLGNGLLSLVSQLGFHKFSYCLVPFSSNHAGKLKFGEEATISESNGVVSTPMITQPGDLSSLYFLNIEGISVGGKTVKRGKSEDGNILIDSGATLTYLPSSLYKNVEALIKKAIGVGAVQNPPDPLNLCFKNESVATSNKNSINFLVHFKGATISLTSQHIFIAQDDLLCFAMLPTDGFPIYGNVAQVNFQVEYDRKGRKVFFAPADCTKS